MSEHDDRPVMCLKCETEVTLRESERGTLAVRCQCGKRRPVKVSSKIPEGWV